MFMCAKISRESHRARLLELQLDGFDEGGADKAGRLTAQLHGAPDVLHLPPALTLRKSGAIAGR